MEITYTDKLYVYRLECLRDWLGWHPCDRSDRDDGDGGSHILAEVLTVRRREVDIRFHIGQALARLAGWDGFVGGSTGDKWRRPLPFWAPLPGLSINGGFMVGWNALEGNDEHLVRVMFIASPVELPWLGDPLVVGLEPARKPPEVVLRLREMYPEFAPGTADEAVDRAAENQ
jgi:hypothetical protein